MASLTKEHIQKCLQTAINTLNRSGERTPWQDEKVFVLSSDEKWKAKELCLEFFDAESQITDGKIDWYICMDVTVYGYQGGLVIAVNELELISAQYNPYKHIVTNWLDPTVRKNLKYIKEYLESDESDDYEGIL